MGYFSANDPKLFEKLNKLYDQVQRVSKISVGPGLISSILPGGISIGLSKSVKGESKKAKTGSKDNLKELASTQGTQDTDTWDPVNVSADSSRGFQVLVYTDLKYDETTHKITARLRTLKFDSKGCAFYCSGEGALVDITEAVACTKV